MVVNARRALRPWLPVAMLLALVQGLAAPPPAWSQAATKPSERTLPTGSVLAIRLVSASEVHPTTGVLVTTDGLVLVPASFAVDEGELLVLDGGGNVARNGRRASVAHRLPGSGLVLLQVEGLRGTPLPLTEVPGVDGERLHFGAFPPAEQMATGMGPMWLGVTLSANPDVEIYGLEGERPIPNVSGPLFNRCEQWVGYALADGTPQLKSEFQPIVLFSRELRRVLDSLDIPYTSGVCPPAPEPVTAGIDPPGGAEDTPLPQTVDDEPQIDLGLQAEPEPAVPAEDSTQADGAAPSGQAGDAPPAAAPAGGRQQLAPWWLAILVVLAVACGWWLRSRRARPDSPVPAAASAPRSGDRPTPRQFQPLPEAGQLGAVDNAFLQLQGETASGQPLRLHVPIDRQAFKVLVTRQGDGLVAAPAAGDQPTGQAGQAPPALALQNSDAGLLLTVLESPQQVWLGGAGVWPGEQLYISHEDVIMLGRTRFTVHTYSPTTP